MPDGSHPRVLVVDDDEATAFLEKRSLSRAGFDVSLAHNPEGALDLLGKLPIRAMVVDHQLNLGTGIELYRDAVHRGLAVPAVMVTGLQTPELEEAARAIGIASFLPKSLTFLDELPGVVGRLLENGC